MLELADEPARRLESKTKGCGIRGSASCFERRFRAASLFLLYENRSRCVPKTASLVSRNFAVTWNANRERSVTE
jgi:hypothetical protein